MYFEPLDTHVVVHQFPNSCFSLKSKLARWATLACLSPARETWRGLFVESVSGVQEMEEHVDRQRGQTDRSGYSTVDRLV